MEKKKGYSMFERDKLDPADSMRIERNIYFEEQTADLSGLTALPSEQLQALREEYAAAEQAAFEALQEQAAAWDEQAGKTLAIDKAIEYVRTPEATHTANQWEATDYGKHISNRVYQMRYHISENTRYDREKEKSIPYSWTLSWSIYTNSPHNYGQAKIAGQERKVFADKAAMEKYLNGRIKAYQHLFTEVSPPIPPEYADHFKVNGQLLPGYAIEGEERAQPTAEKAAPATAEPPQDTEQRKERETINEQFSILIDSRSRFETGEPGGVWLPMPTTTQQLHAAMESVGITADNPQDFFINGYSSTEDCPFDLPLSVIQSASMDELNYFGKLLEMQSDGDKDKFTAAVAHGEYAGSMKDLINLAQNLDCYWLYPTVRSEEDYGYYLIDELDELELPEEAKKYFKYEEYGRDAVSKDKGQFTEQGYIYNNQNTFTEWYRGTENEIPKEYRVMSFPQPERGGQDKTFMDAAATEQTARTAAKQPQEPRPVIPIVLTAGKPAEKLKEITDRLEQGIAELFDSERYKEYLKVMSKFHNYSFRNTVLIAMQKPDASLLAGFSAWKNNFERNVMRGEKGIKIIAPSPYKIKQEMQKIDPHTQKPIIGKDGKPVTEEKEITIPAYKVVSVFDVSQTEGKELPDIAVDELTGDVDRYKDFFAALEKTSPVPIAFENIGGGSHGYYHLEDKRIAINEGMSELQTLKTAIHEIAHAKLHDIDLNAPKDEQPRVDRRTREVEAESVAYTVCQHYGLDTSDYSFGYVAGWSSGRELSELKSSLETIRSAAAEIINSIDGNLAELQKAQDKEQTAGQEQPTREEQAAPPEKPEPEEAAPGKSGAQEKAGAAPKEAFTPETIYKVRRNPYGDSRENSHLLQAYVTQENGRAKMGDVLYTGTPEKCRELMGQLKSGGLTEGDVKQLYAKAQETAQTAGQDKDTFSIYQIKGRDETRDLRFEPYDRLQAAGNVVDRANYELVYSAPLAPETSLEDIYARFNIDHPKDFKGHSLSVSDVVVLHQDGQDAAHFVDSVGFREVPEFLQEQKQLTPDDLETGETVKTPRGTFHVTAMSREQIEAAGYGFHHQSDDGKYLIMGNGTRAFAVAAEHAQRDNPLKTAEQTTEQNGNMIDGIINNTPTVDELEAKVKAGEQISLVDLANAVKADKERGKGAKPEKKPSIRAQLRADKEKAQKKNAKQKSQDLERS
ncbi:YodL domain-containing protein [Neglectibacter caecimuris]|uniref:YodL domain-containing protein n=1 Tax=Neglectibacter caecimuris TaxID=3093658 RepID=UPI002AC8B6BD|nr:YodL domain-containing protein [Neglectibacter sp. M00184]